jgi:hypothetical protein
MGYMTVIRPNLQKFKSTPLREAVNFEERLDILGKLFTILLSHIKRLHENSIAHLNLSLSKVYLDSEMKPLIGGLQKCQSM